MRRADDVELGFRNGPPGTTRYPADREPLASQPFTVSEVDPALPGNRSSGKLFFTNPGEPGRSVCSGAVVDAENQSVIVTAGHCVLGRDASAFSENMLFVPGYRNGDAPFGEFPAERQFTTDQWAANRNTKYDFASVVLGRDNGRLVEDVVGGLPIAFNQPRNQTYRQFAYPSQPAPPYDGQRMFSCESAYDGDVEAASGGVPYEGPRLMSMGCSYEGGSSGGVWLNPDGVVTTVNSNGIPPQDLILGPYLDDVAAGVFNAASAVVPETGTCDGLPVTQLGTSARDQIAGTGGDDVIAAGGKADRVIGGAGNDTICAGGGNDRLGGGGGTDRLFGGQGKDRIDGGPGTDSCHGGPAKDQLNMCP